MTRCSPHRRVSSLALALWFASGVCMVWAPCATAAIPHRVQRHDFKQQVEELEEQWRTAQLNADVATMDKLLSDDYIGISLNGQVNTKSQQMERIGSRRIALTRLELSDMKVKLIGSIAIVTSRAEVEGISDSQPIKGIYRYTRVYQHLPNGAWKITSFEATRTPQSHAASDSNR
ncbi:MAG: hypothetical protein JWM43_2331 [Acidobacteriaceae bacterium]|nr:hypothetical protein [Acidobacteriaceae bacterium]